MPHNKPLLTKKEADLLVEEYALWENQSVFDGDWDWQIEHTQNYGSEEQKEADIPYLKRLQRKYAEEDISGYAAVLEKETEETKALEAINPNDARYKTAIEQIHAVLERVIETNNLNEEEIIRSLTLIKENLDSGQKEMDHTAVTIKSFILVGNKIQITKHELALCIQHFIGILNEIKEEGE